MDRLTFDGNFCDISMCREPYPCKYHDTGCSQKQVWERLKAYEDTGLTQEQVEKMRWIPVTERLPEIGVDYLVHRSGFHDRFARFSKNLRETSDCCFYPAKYSRPGFYDYDSDIGFYEVEYVTHWMPLPEPPEVENNG